MQIHWGKHLKCQATILTPVSQVFWVNHSRTLLLLCMPGGFVLFAEYPMPPWAAHHKNKYFSRLAAPATWGAQRAEFIKEPGRCWLGPLQPEGQTGKQQMWFRATGVHCQASPSGPGDGEHGPKLTECLYPLTSLWTLNSPVLGDRRERKRLYRAWFCAPHSSGEHLQGTPSYSPGDICRHKMLFSCFPAFHSPHWAVTLCSAHTIIIVRATKLMATFTCISWLE